MSDYEKPSDRLLNIILFGESAVGKTTLIMRFFSLFVHQNRYDKDVFSTQHFTTLGSEFILKKLDLGPQEITLKIWDTAGQERFMTMTKSFYKQAHGVILVYDVTKKHSFDKLETWIASVSENAHSNVVKYLIANKTDLVEDRVITPEMGKEFSEKHGLVYFETSAKNNTGVNEMFMSIAKDICTQQAEGQNESVMLKDYKEVASQRFLCC